MTVAGKMKHFLENCSMDHRYGIQPIDETARQLHLEGEGLVNRLLGQTEQRLFPRKATVKRKVEWLSGRLAAKKAVLAMPVKDPFHVQEIEILTEETGAPYVYPFPHLSISISHSHGYAVAASANHPVGIDLERVEKRPACLLKYFYTEAEQSAIAGCKKQQAGMMQATLFWTRKEAVAKCLRLGGRLNFKRIDTTSKKVMVGDYPQYCLQVTSAYIDGYCLSIAFLKQNGLLEEKNK